MAVNTGLAELSDTVFRAALGTYALAMVGYCAEYAFGRRGLVAQTSELTAPARVLAGVGGRDSTADATGTDRPSAVAPVSSAASNAPGAPPTARVDALDAGADDDGPTGRALADRVGRGAVLLTVLGAALHLASLILRGVATDRVPLGNMYEFTAVVGFIGVCAWLVTLARVPGLRYVGMFVMLPIVVVLFIGGTVLYARAAPLVPALQSYWLRIHVTAISAGEGLLMVSAVFTGLYLIRNRHDAAVAGGRPLRGLSRVGASLPESAALDRAAYRIVAFAFPIFTFGVICGAIWAEAAWGRYWGWDPKETWAFISWVVYAAYLHARATAGWKGRNAAWINLAGFGAMTFNFFVVNIVVSGLHSYAGLN